MDGGTGTGEVSIEEGERVEVVMAVDVVVTGFFPSTTAIERGRGGRWR